jgi:hypothetical protein
LAAIDTAVGELSPDSKQVQSKDGHDLGGREDTESR